MRDASSQTQTPMRVGIYGLGLIGGSFAKAYHEAGWEVFVANRTTSTVEFALIEIADAVLDETTIPKCDLIVLASFPAACVQWLEQNATQIEPSTLVIDACGIKENVCMPAFDLAQKHGFSFVGAHPMAGSQNSGFAHSRANLFAGASIVLCPPPIGDIERVELIEKTKALLEPCHFSSFRLATPSEHDKIIAYTSQLPHLIANAYIKSPTNKSKLGFTGGSYRDLTRVAQLSADMWSDLFVENADQLSHEVESLISELTRYKAAIDARDIDRLRVLLEEGDSIKRAETE